MIDVSALRQGDLTAFFTLIRDIYPQEPVRSQLLLEQWGLFQPFVHPVLNHIEYKLFLAWDGRRPVGRVAAIIDKHNPDPATGFFGLFEAGRSREAAEKLLLAAGGWLRDRGKTVMIGPLSFNTNQKVGALIEGFDQPPQPALPYNPPYYRELLEGAGLEKELDLAAYLWDPAASDQAKVVRVAERARRRLPGLVVRRMGGTDLLRAGRAVGIVYNRCMAGGWRFIPLTERELEAFLQRLAYGGRGIFLLAETAGSPAGISLSVPSRGEARFRLAIFGVTPEYQGRGLAAVLLQETIDAYAQSGCRQVELSLVAENNDLMNRIVGHAGAKVTRRYRVYRRGLA